MNTKILNRIIFVLSIVGILIAVYVLQSWLRQTSIICLTNGCETVRKHPASYPFGIPVPVFGLVGYSLLAILSFFRTVNRELSTHLLKPMLGIGLFGISFITWFTYTEITIIKGICMWCAISGLNMFIVFTLLLVSRKIQTI